MSRSARRDGETIDVVVPDAQVTAFHIAALVVTTERLLVVHERVVGGGPVSVEVEYARDEVRDASRPSWNFRRFTRPLRLLLPDSERRFQVCTHYTREAKQLVDLLRSTSPA